MTCGNICGNAAVDAAGSQCGFDFCFNKDRFNFTCDPHTNDKGYIVENAISVAFFFLIPESAFLFVSQVQ